MNILIISDNSEENSILDTLLALGYYENTLLTVTALLSKPASSYSVDLLIVTRISNSTSNSVKLLDYFNTINVPILIGYVNYASNGIGGASSNALGILGLCNSTNDPNSLNTMKILVESPVILNNNPGLQVDGSFDAYPKSEYISTIPLINMISGSVALTCVPSTPNVITSAIFAKDSITLTGNILQMDVIFLGFLSGRLGHSSITRQIVKNSIEFLTVKKYKVSGSVTSLTKEPLERNIYVLNQADMKLLESGRSEKNGLYTIPLRENKLVTVICASEGSDKNSLISSNITPVLREDIV